jgi:hypothetical protein
LEAFNDSFASWQFGEIDYIDSIKNLQDGIKVTFPLYYNLKLLSFETSEESRIDLNSVLLIFINGVIQEPKIAYQFGGGSYFTLTDPPKPEDNISIFFYRGTRNLDSVIIDVKETVKIGDEVQVLQNSYGTTPEQNSRTIYNLSSSNIIETNLYLDQGIDSVNYRPFSWTKQKRDQIINEQFVYKTRDSLESMIYPTSKVIKNFSNTDNEIFIDDAQFFNYENQSPISFDALIVNDSSSNANGSVELITNITSVQGFSGIVTGITTSNGIGTPLALKFYLNSSEPLTVGNPIYIFNTNIGNSVVSIYNSNNSKVAIGTMFVDNIYNISAYSTNGTVGIITCNILSTTPTEGLTTSGSYVGNFSWGKLSGFTRSISPISIGASGYTTNVGLSTFASIQRRGSGLRSTGALRKSL